MKTIVRVLSCFILLEASGLISNPSFGQVQWGGGSHTIASDPATRFYDNAIEEYMNGRWSALETRLKDQAQIDTLTKEQRDDILYMRKAIAECRPDWWNKAKAAAPTHFQATLWNQKVDVNFKNSDSPSINYRNGDRGLLVDIAWPSAEMDSMAPIATETGPSPDFLDDDLANEVAWFGLEFARLKVIAAQQKLPPVPAAKAKFYTLYSNFRGALAAAYYGKPQQPGFLHFFRRLLALKNALPVTRGFVRARRSLAVASCNLT